MIYHGDAKDSLDYFKQLGFGMPKFNNPSDFYMKLMNEEGLRIEKMQKNEAIGDRIEEEFQSRINMFVLAYKRSSQYKEISYNEKGVLRK